MKQLIPHNKLYKLTVPDIAISDISGNVHHNISDISDIMHPTITAPCNVAGDQSTSTSDRHTAVSSSHTDTDSPALHTTTKYTDPLIAKEASA